MTYNITRSQFPLDSEQGIPPNSLAAVHVLREKAVREDIARRVRPVCSHCSDDEFNELVRKMAEEQVRYERKLSW